MSEALLKTTPDSCDLKLIADCQAFTALQMRLDASVCRAAAGSAAERRYEARLMPLWDQSYALADRISQRQATTQAGLVARARALLCYPERTLVEGIENREQGAMILALLRDLVGE